MARRVGKHVIERMERALMSPIPLLLARDFVESVAAVRPLIGLVSDRVLLESIVADAERIRKWHEEHE